MKTTLLRSLPTALLASALLAAPALAAAPSADPHGAAQNNIFAGDVGNVLWTLIIFGLVLFVLGKFAWKPLLGVLHEREAFIKNALEEARSDRIEAKEALAGYTEQIKNARAEATALVEEGRRDAEVVKARIEAEAREEAHKMVDRARREIELAKETAVKDLYVLTARLATDIAGKIIERELAPQDHERLVRESIGEIESLSPTQN